MNFNCLHYETMSKNFRGVHNWRVCRSKQRILLHTSNHIDFCTTLHRNCQTPRANYCQAFKTAYGLTYSYQKDTWVDVLR